MITIIRIIISPHKPYTQPNSFRGVTGVGGEGKRDRKKTRRLFSFFVCPLQPSNGSRLKPRGLFIYRYIYMYLQ